MRHGGSSFAWAIARSTTSCGFSASVRGGAETVGIAIADRPRNERLSSIVSPDEGWMGELR